MIKDSRVLDASSSRFALPIYVYKKGTPQAEKETMKTSEEKDEGNGGETSLYKKT